MKKHGSPIESSRYSASAQKKLTVLGILGALIVILLWIASLPFNFNSKNTSTTAGPSSVFHILSEHISVGAQELMKAQKFHNNTQESN